VCVIESQEGVVITTERAAANVLGDLYVVGIVVVLAATAGVFVFGFGSPISNTAPQVGVSHSIVDDGGDSVVAVTLDAGTSVNIDQLYVIASETLDIGGPPGSSTPADDTYASERETFAEASGSNPPQIGIGDTWDAGETVYFDPSGDANGITIGIYWNPEPVEGINPGTVTGDESYKIAEIAT
jgi:hypothetical protein